MSPRDLSQIDLQSILIQEGDLPEGYSGGAILDQESWTDLTLPEPAKAASQRILRDRAFAGVVNASLYADVRSARNAYSRVLSVFEKDCKEDPCWSSLETLSDVGERCALRCVCHMELPKDICDTVFVTDTAFVFIRLVCHKNSGCFISYAKRLDLRIRDLLT